jgi:hypothetical protein
MISKLAVRGRIPLVISKTRRTPTRALFFKHLLSTIVVHFAKFEPIIAFNFFFAHKLLHTLLHSRMFWWTLSR